MFPRPGIDFILGNNVELQQASFLTQSLDRSPPW
jgi:hypothetical protein